MDDQDKKKWVNWLGVPFQMAATIFVGYWLGTWLDGKYPNDKQWWTLGSTLLAVMISLYLLIREVQGLSKK